MVSTNEDVYKRRIFEAKAPEFAGDRQKWCHEHDAPRVAIEEKEPRIAIFYPEWWHGHGTKMQVEKLDIEGQTLFLKASAANVRIKRASRHFPEFLPALRGWLVDWEVVLWRPIDLAAHGRTQFSNEDLSAAFGLTDDSDISGEWLIERFGGTSASQGEYIRYRNFLNIPCPVTGHDGDPNVSIEITDEIQEAIRQLLNL